MKTIFNNGNLLPLKSLVVFVLSLLLGSDTFAQKIQATVNSGAHLIQTTDWNVFRNVIISVEHIDGTNRHFYPAVAWPYNPNAMNVEGLDADFAQGTSVVVYVVKPLFKLASANVEATVTSGPHLIKTMDWAEYAYSNILVEELDGRNQHIYIANGTRPTNPNAMYVEGIDVDFAQGTQVRVYNLNKAFSTELVSNVAENEQYTSLALSSYDKASNGINERVRILGNGYVGIGTPAPQAPLDVKGSVIINGPGNTLTLQKSSNNIPALAFQGAAGVSTLIEAGDDHFTTYVGGQRRFTIQSDGKVGIGTNGPEAKLHVYGTANANMLGIGSYTLPVSGDEAGVFAIKTNHDNNLWSQSIVSYGTGGKGLRVYNSGGAGSTAFEVVQGAGSRFIVDGQGDVGIGTNDPKGYKLAVAGKIRTTEVKVEPLPWFDYVFEPSYKLPDLKETEKFIKENKHLPEIPSDKEVQANGLELGKMNSLLLKKVEEITLYLIEIKKENELLKERLNLVEEAGKK